jgi:hypothetical protein
LGVDGPKETIIQGFRPLLTGSPHLTTQQHWDLALKRWRSATKSETAWLDLLGWFCLRPLATGKLFASDIEFHNTNFPDPSALAVIFHSADEKTVAVELYTSLPDSPLHSEKHRRISLRLSVGIEGLPPVIRPKVQDRAFLRAYEIAGAIERAERPQQWRERLHRFTHFEWLRRPS